MVMSANDVDKMAGSDERPTSVREVDDAGPVKNLTDDKVDEFGAATERSPEELALVRRLDLYCMPILWVMYFFNFLDRNAIVNGKINKLDKDLNMQGTEYNTCISILFVGYIAGQVPSNMILSKVRPSLYMSGFMLAWSIITLMTYKAHDYVSMLMLRFLLGIFEAPFYPGALYVLSRFYTRKEIAARMSVFYTGNMAASAFSGLIAAAVFQMDGILGHKGWQWLFIIQGSASIAITIPAFYLLPDDPLTTRWLTPEQRQLAHDRIVRDTTGFQDGETSVWQGLFQAARDWRTWAFSLMVNMHLTTTGFKNFLPTAIETLGFDSTTTLALTCPPYVLAAVVSIVVAWNSGRVNERTWHVTASKAVAIVGFIMGVVTLNVPVRYVGIVLFVGASYGVNNILMGWTGSVLGQTNEKKAVALAMANTFGNLASVYTPYLWPDSDKPYFMKAIVASCIFSLGVIVMAWILKIALRRKNAQMRRDDPYTTNFFVY